MPLSSVMKSLAQSPNYEIVHEYETVWLRGAGLAPVVIGDFYGDPDVALIDADEQWCAVAGAGVIVYFIAAPFEAYRYGQRSTQYVEVGREGPAQWWVESLEQVGASSIRVRLEGGAVHELSFHRTGAGCEVAVAPVGDEASSGVGDE